MTMALDKNYQSAVAERELLATKASLATHKAALESMRDELAEARSHGERGWQRVKVLEERIEKARVDLEGK